MINKRTIRELSIAELNEKKVLVRVDFNVPEVRGDIADDARIEAAVPTIAYLKDRGAKVILISHMGRPKGKVVEDLRMKPVADRLAEFIHQPVFTTTECIGPAVESQISNMKAGDVMLLENVRFHAKEEKNDPKFAEALAKLADIYVNDAFGCVHRAHASTAGVAHFLPSYAGFLLEKEISFLGQAIHKPQRPFVAIIGGAKISTKIDILKNLLNKVDVLVIGGAMAYTFLKAQGIEVGKSLIEMDKLDEAKKFLNIASQSKAQILLPLDHVVADKVDASAHIQTVDTAQLPVDMMGVDIGPKTIKAIQTVVLNAKTVLWNGPLGVFEIDAFAKGTMQVAKALANTKAVTIIGGGDSASAIRKSGFKDKMTHISTGGGASLEFLEGRELPGITVLQERAS